MVWRAMDREMRRFVAVKILRSPDPELRARFAQEVDVVANLQHPNVIQAVARGETQDGAPYVALEMITGQSLRARLDADGPLPWREVVAIGVALAGRSRGHGGAVHRARARPGRGTSAADLGGRRGPGDRRRRIRRLAAARVGRRRGATLRPLRLQDTVGLRRAQNGRATGSQNALQVSHRTGPAEHLIPASFPLTPVSWALSFPESNQGAGHDRQLEVVVLQEVQTTPWSPWLETRRRARRSRSARWGDGPLCRWITSRVALRIACVADPASAQADTKKQRLTCSRAECVDDFDHVDELLLIRWRSLFARVHAGCPRDRGGNVVSRRSVVLGSIGVGHLVRRDRRRLAERGIGWF